MKTIITIILLAFLNSKAEAQTAAASSHKSKNCSLVYSHDDDALIYKDTAQYHGQEILIESLPYFEKLTIPVYVSESLNGHYTFKKHPSLVLPEYFSVVIEDSLTGKFFDLKISESYTFFANQNSPERFVLKMNKEKSMLTAMR